MTTDREWYQIYTAWGAVICIAVCIIATIVAPLLTPNTNSIADTISDVAAGPWDWIQDLGFYSLAVGLCAIGYGMWCMGERKWHWWLSILSMPIMAVAIAIMGFYQEYGDGDEGGIVIHIYLVYLFGGSFLALLLLSIPVLQKRNSWWKPLNIAIFVGWAAVAFFYFNMGTQWDGLLERALGLAYLIWIFLLAWRLAIEGGSEIGAQAAEATGTG